MFFTNSLTELYPEVNIDNYPLREGNKSDYTFQVNGLSKILKKTPQSVIDEITTKLKNNVDISVDLVSEINTITINMADEYLIKEGNELLKHILTNKKILPQIIKCEKIIIDFSSPNLAKEMHVGHLRSTIIGESLCRVFEYLGHDVLRVNHLGDHGTAFGMLIAYLKEKSIMNYDITELTKIYKEAKKLFDADNDFKTKARLETFSLQQGLEENKIIWEKIYKISTDIYEKEGELETTYSREYLISNYTTDCELNISAEKLPIFENANRGLELRQEFSKFRVLNFTRVRIN